MWKGTLRTRRALKAFDERWRLSLAGCDPMTGNQAAVPLPSFVIHPETRERLDCTENWKWLNPNEEIRAVHTLPVGGIDCTVLTTPKALEQWLNVMPANFPRRLDVAGAPKPKVIGLEPLTKWLITKVNRTQSEDAWRKAAEEAHPQHRIPERHWRKAWGAVPASQKLQRGEKPDR